MCFNFYLSFRYNCKPQLLIHKIGTSFREISLIWNKAASAKAARTTKFVKIFGPFWI